MMKENTRPAIEMLMQKPIEQIPDNPLNNEKTNEIKSEDIYIDDDYVDDFRFFPPLSTDDRKDFEIKVRGGDLIPYKFPLLTTVDISKSKKQLKDALNKTLKDLNANITYFKTNHNEDQNLKRIRKIEWFINKIDLQKKKKLKKKLIKTAGLNH